MKFYLAARYSRRAELCEHRDLLRSFGHEVTSRWLDGDYPTDGSGRSLVADDETRARVAREDLADVMAADVVISFTEPGRSDGRGGRHVEFGVAIAFGKKTITIGMKENVFHCLPTVEVFEKWTDFLDTYFPVHLIAGG